MFKVGDFVKRKMSGEEAQLRADADCVKGRILAQRSGRKFHLFLKEGDCRASRHTGKATTYMHTNQAYRVTKVTPEGGLRLEGFTLTVSQDEVVLASPEDRRVAPALRWGK